MEELGPDDTGDTVTGGGGRSTLLRTDKLGEDTIRSTAHWGPRGSDTKESVGRRNEVSNESPGSGKAIDRTDGDGRKIDDSYV